MLTQKTKTRSNPDVVVVGEALIDIITTSEGPVEFPGGSGMNVAFGLGRLGVNTGMLTVIGADARGQRIAEHLQSAGVQLFPGATRLKRTSSATATPDSTGSAHYTFAISWDLPPVTPTYIPKVLHTGSLATFLEPGAANVRALMEDFAGKCLITYDPNVRSALLGHQTSAQTIFEATASMANIVKLSDEDAAWLYPGLSAAEVASRIVKLGAKMVSVTAGARGSYLYSKLAQVNVPAVPTTTVDTVGAGDSYMASLIAGILEDPEQVFDRQNLWRLGTTAAAAAAITVSRQGANPPTASELRQAMESESRLPLILEKVAVSWAAHQGLTSGM